MSTAAACFVQDLARKTAEHGRTTGQHVRYCSYFYLVKSIACLTNLPYPRNPIERSVLYTDTGGHSALQTASAAATRCPELYQTAEVEQGRQRTRALARGAQCHRSWCTIQPPRAGLLRVTSVNTTDCMPTQNALRRCGKGRGPQFVFASIRRIAPVYALVTLEGSAAKIYPTGSAEFWC